MLQLQRPRAREKKRTCRAVNITCTARGVRSPSFPFKKKKNCQLGRRWWSQIPRRGRDMKEPFSFLASLLSLARLAQRQIARTHPA
jgi:hypothetical protein